MSGGDGIVGEGPETGRIPSPEVRRGFDQAIVNSIVRGGAQ